MKLPIISSRQACSRDCPAHDFRSSCQLQKHPIYQSLFCIQARFNVNFRSRFVDCDKPLKKNKWNLLFLTGLCLAATLAGCYLLMPSDASEEYAYTVNSLFRFGFIPLLLLTAILFYLSRRGTPAACFMARNCGWFLFCFAGILLISYPVFSPWAGGAHWSLGITFSICWAMGTLCMAVGLFWLSSRFENLLAAQGRTLARPCPQQICP